MNTKVNGSFGPLREYELREDSDDWFGTEENRIHSCSFEIFRILWLTHYPTLQMRSSAYDTCETYFKSSYNLSAIIRNVKDNDICLRTKELHCRNSNVFDEGKEADIELIDIPDLIDMDSVELDDYYKDSYQASSNASSQLSAHDMSGDEDDDMLVHHDVSCTGSEKDKNYERENFVKEMYAHTLAWSMQIEFIQARLKRQM